MRMMDGECIDTSNSSSSDDERERQKLPGTPSEPLSEGWDHSYTFALSVHMDND